MNETSGVKVSLVKLSFQRKVVNMKKIKPVLAIPGIVVLLFAAVLTMMSGVANAGSATATRTLPEGPVPAGEGFTVTIEVSGYGMFGQVAETLPEGFTYRTSTLPPRSVRVFGNTVEFIFLGETSFTYTVKAPDTEGTYTISGILKDGDKNEYEVGGDTEIEVEEEEEDEEAEPTFDTGSGTYPSISGTHKGTIEPDQDITVHKLYTYPCSGTGGHSEYVKIWNETWSSVGASWTGYKGDNWHNISFDELFILKKGKIYNYSIRTGSYPQIIHAKEFNVIGGKITCTEFIDVNGKVYNDWIPAIRLWA